jgi:hypothetical protein
MQSTSSTHTILINFHAPCSPILPPPLPTGALSGHCGRAAATAVPTSETAVKAAATAATQQQWPPQQHQCRAARESSSSADGKGECRAAQQMGIELAWQSSQEQCISPQPVWQGTVRSWDCAHNDSCTWPVWARPTDRNVADMHERQALEECAVSSLHAVLKTEGFDGLATGLPGSSSALGGGHCTSPSRPCKLTSMHLLTGERPTPTSRIA